MESTPKMSRDEFVEQMRKKMPGARQLVRDPGEIAQSRRDSFRGNSVTCE